MKILKKNTSLLFLLAVPLWLSQTAQADYQATVLSDGPKAYYRLNDDTSRTLINKNSGSLGAAGDATNDLSSAGDLHPFPGAIVGDPNRAVFFDFSTRTEIPFSEALNPPNTQPFTIEAWLYPSSDQTGNGMSPLANRWTLTGDRQGWVFFQRKPSEDYFGGEPVGWNCRMYNGIGGSGRLEVTSLVPYQIGKWQHVVVVYDPVQVTNATLTMYIDGVAANTNIWAGGASGTDPGYLPVTSNLDPQPMMALGNYNNANSGLNPYYGGVDEFAVYSAKLSPAQILSHYQNATNANRSQSYDSLVKSHNPAAYLRLDEIAPGADLAVNLGDLRKAGLASHTAEVRHPAPGALVGQNNGGSVAYHNRNGRSTTTMPFSVRNNPNAGIPFTFETWLRPMRDSNGGQAPVNNRWPKLGHRTGWVIFQRTPNLTYAQGPGEGHGWNFRMYNGFNGSGSDVVTGTDFVVGEWQHLVVTWEPQIQNGDVGGFGNDQWQGMLTAYVNGVLAAQNPSAIYAANREIPEDGGVPADFAVGSYNAASNLGDNPFEGDVDEVAFYDTYALTPDQIMAHYQAGTNANYGTNYSTLVMTAGFFGPERVGLPATYLQFDDPARYPIQNSGTLGFAADGNLSLTTNSAEGPRPPTYAGFGASNAALPLDGGKQWASLNNPSGLNISGQITLEAWIKPGASQNDPARIISHGPQTLSSFLSQALDNAVTNTSEVFLAIEGFGANYVVGSRESIDGAPATTYSASFPVPGGDLGGTDWIHLVGTYDGSNWRLFRNGAQVANAPGPIGALPVSNADWAIGSTGNGWEGNYTGDVDEVAIYSAALTPAQIANHYVIGRAGTTALTVTRSGSNVMLNWPSGTTLLESSSVTGPFTPRSGNPVSPLTIPATGTMFYRWSL